MRKDIRVVIDCVSRQRDFTVFGNVFRYFRTVGFRFLIYRFRIALDSLYYVLYGTVDCFAAGSLGGDKHFDCYLTDVLGAVVSGNS